MVIKLQQTSALSVQFPIHNEPIGLCYKRLKAFELSSHSKKHMVILKQKHHQRLVSLERNAHQRQPPPGLAADQRGY